MLWNKSLALSSYKVFCTSTSDVTIAAIAATKACVCHLSRALKLMFNSERTHNIRF